MQLLASRDYPVIDYQTMGEFIGHERLFRAADGAFLLVCTENLIRVDDVMESHKLVE